MRWTICYGMMFISLGSVLVYTITNAEQLRDPFNDIFGQKRAFIAAADGNQSPIVIAQPAMAAPIAPANEIAGPVNANAPAAQSTDPAGDATISVIDAAPIAIMPGMTAAQITAAYGEPDIMSTDGSRWTYGNTVLIFNNDHRLAGHIGFDPVQAALNKYDNVMASISPDKNDAAKSANKSKAKNKTGSKILSRSVDSYASSANYYGKGSRYRPITAASSRDAYRYNTYGDEYSYYMNRYGPMNKTFVRKPSMPRGMSTSYDRNMGSAYQAFGNRSRYGSLPNIEYRR